jgi:hypothetical protein
VTPRSWCKVASNLDSHPKIRRAGRNGREVFLFALRKNAEPNNPVPGLLPAAIMEPWYLADQLMMSEAEASDGLTRAVSAGLISQNGECWSIHGWGDEWGKVPADGAARTRKWRESKGVTTVTDTPSQNVTERHSRHCDALDQIRLEETRQEETREDQRPASAKQAKRKVPLPDGWEPERSKSNLEAEEKARARGVDLSLELPKLRDWATANGTKKADWEATWRNWTRTAKPLSGPQRTAGGTRNADLFERQMQRAREAEDAERRGETS